MSLILLVVTYIAVSLFPFVKAMTRSFSVGIGAGVNVAVGESIFALAMSLFSFIAIARICLFEYIYIKRLLLFAWPKWSNIHPRRVLLGLHQPLIQRQTCFFLSNKIWVSCHLNFWSFEFYFRKRMTSQSPAETFSAKKKLHFDQVATRNVIFAQGLWEAQRQLWLAVKERRWPTTLSEPAVCECHPCEWQFQEAGRPSQIRWSQRVARRSQYGYHIKWNTHSSLELSILTSIKSLWIL